MDSPAATATSASLEKRRYIAMYTAFMSSIIQCKLLFEHVFQLSTGNPFEWEENDREMRSQDEEDLKQDIFAQRKPGLRSYEKWELHDVTVALSLEQFKGAVHAVNATLPTNTGKKTAVCVHFMEGYCKYRATCLFGHSINEMDPDYTVNFINFRSKMCTSEPCLRGKKCSYAHTTDELRVVGTGIDWDALKDNFAPTEDILQVAKTTVPAAGNGVRQAVWTMQFGRNIFSHMPGSGQCKLSEAGYNMLRSAYETAGTCIAQALGGNAVGDFERQFAEILREQGLIAPAAPKTRLKPCATEFVSLVSRAPTLPVPVAAVVPVPVHFADRWKTKVATGADGEDVIMPNWFKSDVFAFFKHHGYQKATDLKDIFACALTVHVAEQWRTTNICDWTERDVFEFFEFHGFPTRALAYKLIDGEEQFRIDGQDLWLLYIDKHAESVFTTEFHFNRLMFRGRFKKEIDAAAAVNGEQ